MVRATLALCLLVSSALCWSCARDRCPDGDCDEDVSTTPHGDAVGQATMRSGNFQLELTVDPVDHDEMRSQNYRVRLSMDPQLVSTGDAR